MGHAPSEPVVVVEALRPEHIRVVYPLIRAVDPSIGLQAWLRFARRRAGLNTPRHGVLLARRARQPHPLGAVCYRYERRIGGGSILIAEHFTALDLLFPHQVIRALVYELDLIATTLDCNWIRFVCPQKNQQLLETLNELGHGSEGVLLSRRVARRV